MNLRRKLANTIRILSIDSIQKANSGHPGAPMGMADIAEVLWRDYLNHNPYNPNWMGRDRFILSNGHASILLYCLLHLTGYNLSIEELKNFRKLNSKTPGHPEYGYTDGVEITTGPLGQGIANAVGLALGERTLASQFNKPGYEIINNYTYVFLGDGCMMEGISHEACSLAGTMKLGKLIAFYDDNGISIDGKVKEWFQDNTAKRFEAYGWHVIKNVDGHNSDSIKNAIDNARIINDKPSLLICKTIIAFGSPNKSGSHISHGAPLGNEEVSATRKKLGWKELPFIIPKKIYNKWNSKKIGKKREKFWNFKFSIYEKKFPELSKEFKRRVNKNLPKEWFSENNKIIKNFQKKTKNIASRQASLNTLEIFNKMLPELIGGSADLSPSNLTISSRYYPINKYYNGNYIHYGVREFGMTAIGNGIAIYGGFITYTATFLVFVEYALNAVRMASMMKNRHIMIYTHDSIGLGEDGPTHQPIEQLAILRLIPNLSTWRPCDHVETIVAWKKAIERLNGPTALILSRQNLKSQKRTKNQIDNISKGGYILKDCDSKPELIIIATGSEVNLAISAYKKLKDKKYKIRIVSMPSTDIFDLQEKNYKEIVLPKEITNRIAIEAGSSDYWYKYVGLNGHVIGMKTFGKSGSGEELFNFFNFTVDNIINTVKSILN